MHDPSVLSSTGISRVAGAAFLGGKISSRTRIVLGAPYGDQDFTQLLEARGRPAVAPWRLALVAVIKLAKGFSDRRAAGAVGVCTEQKHAPRLEPTDPSLDFSMLSEFRARLVVGGSERLSIEPRPQACKERGYSEARGRQRTDSTRVLWALRILSESAGAQNGEHRESAREHFGLHVHGSPGSGGTIGRRGMTVSGVIPPYWSRVPHPPGRFRS